MTKKELKEEISGYIDLAGGHFSDCEVERLYELVNNISSYEGMSHTRTNTFTSWCSDGKYTRYETWKYAIVKDGNIYIHEEYNYSDDDGSEGGYEKEHTTAREILNLLDYII